MQKFKQVCREMAADQRILTFSQLAKAATEGALVGQKINSPVIGAVLGMSLQAGKQAVYITQDLLDQIEATPSCLRISSNKP